jgi:cation:H+ antiporter
MIWLQFFISAVITVLAAIKLAEYGDVIAQRTALGGMFIGTVLLATATSLPELLTTISSINQDVPNLAAGAVFGSSMFNMLMLGLLDLGIRRVRLLKHVAIGHALSGVLAVFLTAVAAFFILADIDIRIGWVGLDSLILIILYFFGLQAIQAAQHAGPSGPHLPPPEIPPGVPKLWVGLVGFLVAAGVLVVVTPWLVSSSSGIAEITGIGTGFVGTTLVAMVTSLPEAVTTIAAVRIGAYDMAVGNLFGSNIFNMFTLGITDVFFTQGRFLGAIDPAMALAAIVGILLTGLGLIGNLARVERWTFNLQIDLLIVVFYWVGLWLLYTQGIGL